MFCAQSTILAQLPDFNVHEDARHLRLTLQQGRTTAPPISTSLWLKCQNKAFIVIRTF